MKEFNKDKLIKYGLELMELCLGKHKIKLIDDRFEVTFNIETNNKFLFSNYQTYINEDMFLAKGNNVYPIWELIDKIKYIDSKINGGKLHVITTSDNIWDYVEYMMIGLPKFGREINKKLGIKSRLKLDVHYNKYFCIESKNFYDEIKPTKIDNFISDLIYIKFEGHPKRMNGDVIISFKTGVEYRTKSKDESYNSVVKDLWKIADYNINKDEWTFV